MPAGSAPQAASRISLLVRIHPVLKQRLSKLAFRRSWASNRRVSESSLVEEAIRTFLDVQEKRT